MDESKSLYVVIYSVNGELASDPPACGEADVFNSDLSEVLWHGCSLSKVWVAPSEDRSHSSHNVEPSSFSCL